MAEPKPTAEIAGSAPDPPTGAAAQPARAVRPDQWTRVRELALKQLDRFMSYEPKVLRGDDPDAVHDMRVASRRLQQVLDLIYPKPSPREIQRLRRQLRRCRRALGDVRNCDVLLQRVEGSLKRKRSARREAWTAVQQFLHSRRSESFQHAMRKLSKVNLAVFYVNLRGHLMGFAASPNGEFRLPLSQPPQDSPLPGRFPERVAHSLGAVWKTFEEQVALSHGDPRSPVVHGVRLAAKRLRYLLEVVQAFEVEGSSESLAWLRQLQQHLGDWHDLEVLEQMMVEMIARPDFLREHLKLVMEIEKLILRNRDNKKDFEAKYFAMTRDASEVECLKLWVSYLLESPSAAFAKA